MDDNIISGFSSTYNTNIDILRVIDNTIYSIPMEIKAELINLSEDDYSDDEDDFDLDVSLSKIDYFFDRFVSNSIIYSAGNDWAMERFASKNESPNIGNNIIITPMQPGDKCLAALFQAKINALLPKTFSVMSLRLTNRCTNLETEFYGDPEQILPSMDEWVPGKKFHDIPWWSRNDGSTIDVICPDDRDNSVNPSYAIDLSFFDNIFKSNNDYNDDDNKPKIIKPNFKPKILTNNKKGK